MSITTDDITNSYKLCSLDDLWCLLWAEYLLACVGWSLGVIAIVFLSLEISMERKRRISAQNELTLVSTSTRTAIIPAYPQSRQIFNPPPPEEPPAPKVDYPRDPVPPTPSSRYPPNAFSYLPEGTKLPERMPSYLSGPNPYNPAASSSRWATNASQQSYDNRGYED